MSLQAGTEPPAPGAPQPSSVPRAVAPWIDELRAALHEVIIGQDGLVQARIGDQIQTVGQIRLSRFPNPNGLRADGDNFFRETPSSGVPVEQTPGEGGSGTIRQSFLERSNVAIVDELIALIQAQRNYEVNSRTISVSDEMMQQVSQLI